MSTDSYTGTARRKDKDMFFSSTRFALLFHQNLIYTYTFSCNGGQGISALVFTRIQWLERRINWHETRENYCFLKAFYCQNNIMRTID
ncbi:MAG: hypothetical protein WC446_06245 [Candidatus Paceibacterota bacterium]|jgi:poly(3-hydroxyalkanoate) synthetase